MALDLVLRICQVDEADGGLPGAGRSPGEPGYDPATRHIGPEFVDALYSVLGGYHTVAQVKTFYDMPANQGSQFDALIGKIESAPNLAKQLGRIERFRAILDFWERHEDLNITSYDTPDDIETQLLALDQGYL